NQSTHENQTTYHHMWIMDKIHTTINHTPIDIEQAWEPQWEYNYTFSIEKTGDFKLAFLLFTEPTQNYNPNQDYKHIAKQKMENAYRENHLWISVT
ncbi:MAG: hypothetical protein ACOC80_15440, partial [Petrotogales bacterium]